EPRPGRRAPHQQIALAVPVHIPEEWHIPRALAPPLLLPLVRVIEPARRGQPEPRAGWRAVHQQIALAVAVDIPDERHVAGSLVAPLFAPGRGGVVPGRRGDPVERPRARSPHD